MKLEGTQLDDKKLMDSALGEFQAKARKKFLAGIKEHNPYGNCDKGMMKMDLKEHINSAKDEVMDLWFYLCGMHEWLTGEIEEEMDED